MQFLTKRCEQHKIQRVLRVFWRPNLATCGPCGCSFLHLGRLNAISDDVEVRLGVAMGILVSKLGCLRSLWGQLGAFRVSEYNF